jgi:hypothetical protein
MKTINDTLKRFDEKFVNKTVKQVDTGNSIELPLWKNPHSHQTQDVKDFIVESIKDALEAVRVIRVRAMNDIYDKGFDDNTTQYDENVKSFLGEK